MGCGELADEVFVGIGVYATKAVMDVDDSEDEADFRGGVEHGAEECDGVRSAGDSDGDALAGAKEREIEDQLGVSRRGGLHGMSILVD